MQDYCLAFALQAEIKVIDTKSMTNMFPNEMAATYALAWLIEVLGPPDSLRVSEAKVDCVTTEEYLPVLEGKRPRADLVIKYKDKTQQVIEAKMPNKKLSEAQQKKYYSALRCNEKLSLTILGDEDLVNTNTAEISKFKRVQNLTWVEVLSELEGKSKELEGKSKDKSIEREIIGELRDRLGLEAQKSPKGQNFTWPETNRRLFSYDEDQWVAAFFYLTERSTRKSEVLKLFGARKESKIELQPPLNGKYRPDAKLSATDAPDIYIEAKIRSRLLADQLFAYLPNEQQCHRVVAFSPADLGHEFSLGKTMVQHVSMQRALKTLVPGTKDQTKPSGTIDQFIFRELSRVLDESTPFWKINERFDKLGMHFNEVFKGQNFGLTYLEAGSTGGGRALLVFKSDLFKIGKAQLCLQIEVEKHSRDNPTPAQYDSRPLNIKVLLRREGLKKGEGFKCRDWKTVEAWGAEFEGRTDLSLCTRGPSWKRKNLPKEFSPKFTYGFGAQQDGWSAHGVQITICPSEGCLERALPSIVKDASAALRKVGAKKA